MFLRFSYYLNLGILVLLLIFAKAALGQQDSSASLSKNMGPKVLFLSSSKDGDKEGSTLVYNETKNIVYSRLKKNFDKLGIQRIEGNNKQFVYNINKNSIEIKWNAKKSSEISVQTDFILILESNIKSSNSDNSELLIATYNSCNFLKLTEDKIQYNNRNNWIKKDKKFEKLDSILQSVIYKTLIENTSIINKGRELNCKIEFNLQDSNNIDLWEIRKQEMQDVIENWILTNSIDSQYDLYVPNNNSLLFNSVRMPLFNHPRGVCVDEKLFFEPLSKQLTKSELILYNLPKGINALIRINL